MMSADVVRDYIAADGSDRTVDRLVTFFSDNDFAFGKTLRTTMGLAADTEITGGLIKQYFARTETFGAEDPDDDTKRIVRPKMLRRALGMVQLQILLNKANEIDREKVIKRRIYLLLTEKLRVAGNPNPEQTAMDNLQTDAQIINFVVPRPNDTFPKLTHIEFDALYSDIVTAIEKNIGVRAETRTALKYVQTDVKPATSKDTVKELFEASIGHATKYLSKTQELEEALDKTEPERKLNAYAFLDLPLSQDPKELKIDKQLKDLLINKLDKLGSIKEANEEYNKFNQIVRFKILNPAKGPGADKSKLNAKIKFTLGKLAQVLHAYNLHKDAHEIETQVFGLKYKKDDVSKIDREDAKDAKGFLRGIKDFIKSALRRADLKEDVKKVLSRGDLETKVDTFVVAAAEYPEAANASRKLVNKIRRVVRELNAIAIADASGVEEVPELSANYSRLQAFETFKDKYNELLQRIDVADTTSKNYLPVSDLKADRKNKIKHHFEEINNAQFELSAEIESIKEVLPSITEPAKKLPLTVQLNLASKYNEKLNSIRDKLADADGKSGKEQYSLMQEAETELTSSLDAIKSKKHRSE